MYFANFNAIIAQLVERIFGIDEVIGAAPINSSNFKGSTPLQSSKEDLSASLLELVNNIMTPVPMVTITQSPRDEDDDSIPF